LDVFGEMVSVEGVLVALQSLSTIKKGTSHSKFQSFYPFSKFQRQLLWYEVPWSRKKLYSANIVLYLGRTIALRMIVFLREKDWDFSKVKQPSLQ
jgi:hypothetical protein